MNIKYDEMRSIKALNLPDILRNHGISLKPHGLDAFFARCPFHDDKEPSLSVSKKDNVWLWHCFGCRQGGTVIDFVMKKENLSLSDTYQRLKPMISPGGAGGSATRHQSVGGQAKASADPSGGRSAAGGNGHGLNKLELLKSVTDFYQKTFLEDKRALEYLKARAIVSPEIYSSFKIGLANGSLKKTLPLKGPMIKVLREIGILNDEGNEFFYNCVVIPLLDEDSNVVSLYGRNISGKQHLYLKGPHKGLVNRQGAYGSERLILTESIIDALSLYEMGIRNVIPCYGAGGFTEDHKNLIQKQKIKEIEIVFDNDDAGRAGAHDLTKRIGLKTCVAKLPEGIKDLNDFLLVGKKKEDYLKLDRVEIVSPPSATRSDAEIQKEKGVLHFRSGGRNYRILLPEYDSIHNLRVNIKLTVKDNYHIDVVDLYSERSRRLYAKRISKNFSLVESDIESDLYRILEEIEKLSAGSQQLVAEEQKNLPMSDEEKEEALKALKSPTLTKDIVSDLEKIGCVGEDAAKLLGYIITVSRNLEQPLSMIIVSQSGAGKSNLADTLESIIPPESCVHLSRITPQALYYMDKTALKRKVLIIEEKEGSESADYSIRVLQSKKILRLAVPLKDPQTGRMKTVTFEVEGPVVVIETTTKTDLNPENTSRCFIVYLDESEEQTKRIHAFQRKQKTLEGLKEKKESDRIIRKHQNMQKLLNPILVHIPWINYVRFPSRWMRTRRDYQKFLNLIEAVAFLHQHQRNHRTLDGIECIEADIKDYEIAYSLSKEIFGDCLSELPKPAKDFLDTAKRMLEEQKETRFTRRMIREYSGLADHLVRRLLETLVSLEYLRLVEGKNGLRYEYELAPEPVTKGRIIEGLTTPKELKAHLAETLRPPCSKVNPFGDNELTSPCNLAG